jgi:hypothetical protein
MLNILNAAHIIEAGVITISCTIEPSILRLIVNTNAIISIVAKRRLEKIIILDFVCFNICVAEITTTIAYEASRR